MPRLVVRRLRLVHDLELGGAMSCVRLRKCTNWHHHFLTDINCLGGRKTRIPFAIRMLQDDFFLLLGEKTHFKSAPVLLQYPVRVSTEQFGSSLGRHTHTRFPQVDCQPAYAAHTLYYLQRLNFGKRPVHRYSACVRI